MDGQAVLKAPGPTEKEHDNELLDDPETRRRKKPTSQPRSLFVRSLPPMTTSESLTELFSQSFPLKHATVVIDPTTKQSKGYGFVTFADAEDAQRAREQFNGSILGGKKIRVEIAEPRHRDTDKDGLNGYQRSQPSPAVVLAKAEREKQRLENSKPPKLIVRNLPWSIKEPDQLALLFRSYGKVKHATIPSSKPGTSTGFGFVVLRGRKNAEKALAGVNGKEVDGRTLAVDWAVEKDVWETLQKGENEDEKSDVESVLLESDGGNSSVKSEDDDEEVDLEDIPPSDAEQVHVKDDEDDFNSDGDSMSGKTQDNSSTLFIRNLPFTCTDEILQGHFKSFGAIRYARVVLDHDTGRSKGTGFVCFYATEDAGACLRGAPRLETLSAQKDNSHKSASAKQHSLLEDTQADPLGRYTIDGRVLQITRAVNRSEANRLTTEGSSLRDARDKDKRRLYLLSEGTIPSTSPLYDVLSSSEIKMREDSARQRQALIKSNPSLHLSLTRLSLRNLPRNVTSKDLKALAREAVVGFAKDIKDRNRQQLSKEELSRGGEEMRNAEKERKSKGKGIVKQAKVVFEGKEGGKVAERSGAGRSRGYGFVEYVSHRWALMGLRWMNGHALKSTSTTDASQAPLKERSKRLIVEFAIENAQVVARRHEREGKARERSKLVVARMGTHVLPKRNTTMAKARKDAKGSRGRDRGNPVATTLQPSQESRLDNRNSAETDKLAKRQQIVGRKRMLRKARKSSSA
ncbi:RNA recognition motif-containing protein [Lambiella insularis]|nr:RNA recognition motif-containing protein [Lambiella insularis]